MIIPGILIVLVVCFIIFLIYTAYKEQQRLKEQYNKMNETLKDYEKISYYKFAISKTNNPEEVVGFMKKFRNVVSNGVCCKCSAQLKYFIFSNEYFANYHPYCEICKIAFPPSIIG